MATGRVEDKFKFRTPPLRNVTRTAPYFHNGRAATLDEAIRQHLDPLYYADKYRESGAFVMKPDQIEAISPVLTPGIKLSDDEISALKTFLRALEDSGPANLEQIVPDSVPSGLPVMTLNSGGRDAKR
jgi:cytochrome c peroxidase